MASVLVIDDEPTVRTTIRLMLERDGHDVTVAADGRAGIAALAAGGIDLLVVDIFMPEMDGFEMIREVRRHRPELPAIVISGSSIFDSPEGAPDFLAMAIELGAVRGLRKPFTPEELLGAVHECLGGKAESRLRGKE